MSMTETKAWLPEPDERGAFRYADGSGFQFNSRVGKWVGWWAPEGGRSSVPLRGYDENNPSHETTSFFLTAEEVAQAIADGGDGPAVCPYDPLTHWLIQPGSIRHWNVERLMFGTWLATDWYESGKTEAEALIRAADIVKEKRWEGVRLGRELDDKERNRYCSLAWITLN